MKLRISLILIAAAGLIAIVYLVIRNDEGRNAPLKTQDSKDVELQPAEKVPVKTTVTRPTATKEVWNALKVTKGEKTNSQISYWSIINLRKVLEADTNTTSFHVGATNTRLENGEIVTTILGNKLSNALLINWIKGSFGQADRAEAKNSFSEVHADQEQINNSKILFGFENGEEKPGISLTTFTNDGKEEESFILFNHKIYLRTVGFLSNDYPIGALPLIRDDTRTLESILILDKVNAKIIENIVLPVGAKSGQPTFILDKQNDVLLATQFRLDWIVAIDLKEYVKGIQKK